MNQRKKKYKIPKRQEKGMGHPHEERALQVGDRGHPQKIFVRPRAENE
jgi:hypothetical protein